MEPAGLAWDGANLWVADRRAGCLRAVDPATGELHHSLYCPGNLSGLAWDGRSLWQSLFDQEMIRCINPETNDFDRAVLLEGQGWLSGVAWDGRHLWAAAQQRGQLLPIDLTTNENRPPIPAPVATGDIDYRDGYLWASVAGPMRYNEELARFEWLGDEREYAVIQIDPADGREIGRYSAGELYSGLCWVDDDLWLAHSGSRSLYRARLEMG
jgi:hypothetical protein